MTVKIIGLQRKKEFQKKVCKCVVVIIFIFTPGDGFICTDSGLASYMLLGCSVVSYSLCPLFKTIFMLSDVATLLYIGRKASHILIGMRLEFNF